MYFDYIINRIKKYIHNIDNVIVIDNYKEPYCEKEIIPFSDNKYNIIKNLVMHDEYSIKLLEKMINGRKNNNYLSYYIDVKGYQGLEDYWITVKPKNEYNNSLVFDCGAYIGDSILDICSNVDGKVKYYYAIEPDRANYKRLLEKSKRTDVYDELITLNKAVGNRNDIVNFEQSEICTASHVIDGDSLDTSVIDGDSLVTSVEMIKIDDIPIEEKLDIYIKADIEGSELIMLEGAENLIRSRHPHLAICLYHKSNDIVNIPLYLKSICPEYKFFLRGGQHTVLIAEYIKE